MTGRCRDPKKARYKTRGAAARAAETLRKNGVFSKSRPYRCSCGYWHLTSHL